MAFQPVASVQRADHQITLSFVPPSWCEMEIPQNRAGRAQATDRMQSSMCRTAVMLGASNLPATDFAIGLQQVSLASAAAKAEPDLSTPQAAYASLIQALEQGDFETFMKVVDPVSSARLQALPPELVQMLFGQLCQGAPILKQVEMGRVINETPNRIEYEGTLNGAPIDSPMIFVKDDAGWHTVMQVS